MSTSVDDVDTHQKIKKRETGVHWTHKGASEENQKKGIPGQIQPWLTFLTRICFGKNKKATKASSS
jgi:hypothetical protein